MNITNKNIVEYAIIIVGTSFLAMAINIFFDPLELVTGGVTGLSIVIKELSSKFFDGGIPLWILNISINIPLFIIAIIIKGKNFGGRSLFATLYLSFALYYTQWLPMITTDILLGSVFGGVLAGLGLGLVFSAYSTTGGTDLAASIIQHYIKHVSVAKIMFILDGIIIAFGFFVFGPEKAMYAIVSVYISVKVIDAILDGLHFSKAAFIISDYHEEISKNIFSKLERGVTGLYGEGLYSKKSKEVLMCVVSKKQIVKLKDIVREIDDDAFIIVADVREVLGEGFIRSR